MKNESQHKTAIINAATAFVGATLSLAQAIDAAKADGATPAQIRDWCKEAGVESGNLSKALLKAFGDAARLRAPRSDKGKRAKEVQESAADFSALLSEAFGAKAADGEASEEGEEGDGEEGEETATKKPGKLTAAKVADYIAKRMPTANLETVEKLLLAVIAELKKRAKAAK